MKSTVLMALIALNVVLLISFFARLTPSNTAMAQVARRPGEYAMIPGQVAGGSSGVIYILDTTNAFLTAMTYDTSANPPRLVSMPQINIGAIFAKGAGTADQPNNQRNPNNKR